MKRITLFFIIILMFMLTTTACGREDASVDADMSLSSVLAQNVLSSQSSEAIMVDDKDDSLSDYYYDKQIKSLVSGYWDGKLMTIISGYDTLWESDFNFYLYNGNAYSLYKKYDDDILRYADFSGLNNLGDEYPASQFYFLEKWSPTIVNTETNNGVTKVVYEVTVQDDKSYKYYFSSDYEDIQPGTKLYFNLELNSENKIVAYSLNRDKEGANAIWARYEYSYVTLDEYNPSHIVEYDAKYDQKKLVSVSFIDVKTDETTMKMEIQKGVPFYPEITPDQCVYMDKKCKKPYMDYTVEYIRENGEQYTIEKDTVLYIGDE